MEKKTKPLVSQAQAKHLYDEYRAGKISYEKMMASVHASGPIAKLPERVKGGKAVDKKTAVAIKGLI